MQEDIQICKDKNFDEEKEVECCFQICTKYWNQLREELSVQQFKTEKQEIDFFKNIKPLFTSEIEYFNLVYHSLLFKPSFDHDEIVKFWTRELQRFEKFTETNQEFYKYSLNKETHLDKYFYLRHDYGIFDFEQGEKTELERKTSTSHDHLLTQYLALEKYSRYVNNQIENINRKIEDGNA
jgi:hypothetical protein